jgi:hypothetical protein
MKSDHVAGFEVGGRNQRSSPERSSVVKRTSSAARFGPMPRRHGLLVLRTKMAPTARFPWCFPHGSELLLFSARSCPKSLRTFRDPALGDRSDAEQLPFMRVGEQAAGVMHEQSNRAAAWPSHADHRKLGRLVDFHAEAKFVPIEFHRAQHVRDAQRESIQSGSRCPYAECGTVCPPRTLPNWQSPD